MAVSKQTKDDSKLKDVRNAGVGRDSANKPSDRPKAKFFESEKAGKQNSPRKVKEGAEDENLNIGTDTA
jgi:hypothetical protein